MILSTTVKINDGSKIFYMKRFFIQEKVGEDIYEYWLYQIKL